MTGRPRSCPFVVACLLGAGLAAAGVAQEAAWVEVAKLVAVNAAGGDELGVSVALSGDTAAVGAWRDDDLGGSSGAAYVFERHAGGSDAWGQVAKLLAPDGTSEDRFGSAVAIDGDTVVVGAPQDGLSTDGFAWVFDRDAGGPDAWGPVQKLTGSDGNFGTALALDGHILAVGSRFAESVFQFGPSGSVDIFLRNSRKAAGGSWLPIDNLRPAAGCRDSSTACGAFADSAFGASVAVDGDLLLVGQSDLAGAHSYAFQRLPSGFWARVARPLPASDDNHNDGDQFALAVAVSGETLLMGAPSDDDAGAQSGSVYVFEPDPGGPERWREVAELHSPDPGEGDYLGASVGLDGDRAVAGATRFTSTLPGSAWVFERDAGGPGAWGAVAELTASDGVDGNDFGWSIAVDGDTVIVGATDADDRAGAAYVFQQMTGSAAGPHPALAADTAARSQGPGLRERMSAGRSGEERLGAVLASRRCLDFTPQFGLLCDGLELILHDGQIRGWWRNADCSGLDVRVEGRLEAARAVVGCDPAAGPCPLESKWNWILDGELDGTLDMHRFEETNWNLWWDEVPYTVSSGPCSF